MVEKGADLSTDVVVSVLSNISLILNRMDVGTYEVYVLRYYIFKSFFTCFALIYIYIYIYMS